MKIQNLLDELLEIYKKYLLYSYKNLYRSNSLYLSCNYCVSNIYITKVICNKLKQYVSK